jgi:structural maintenance of chromosome 3 (chondroitin sulfate proteoglycan 6)
MYIKQIIIQGFKSYKDQTVIEPFSPGLNVIVGRNGSGKSNFFAAIRFVLSDAYTQMGREERQALLHEGSGSAVMSAYVEVIFDNSDERFPTGKPELVLRRTIGLKKDEYTLDRKNATKSDVTNLLESAGFSRSNPYYIVPQGRVTTLTNMKDPERLNLLKEVAGTQVYEARRAESLRIMQETDNKRSKIDDLLAYIKERLQELEEEKEELRKYQEKDREHRSLQYTILDREKAEYTRALATIDDQRSGGVDETDTNRETFLEREEEIAEIEAQTSELRQQIEYLTTDKRQLDDERKDAQRDKAKTELDVQSLTTGQSAAQKAKTKHDAELREVQRLIKDRENELTDLMPNYNNQSQQESIIRSQLDEAEATRRRLYAKQGRSAEFTSKRERDEYLKKEIEDFNMQLATRKAVAMQTGEEIKELEHGISSLDAEAVEIRNRIENRGDDLQSISAEAEKAKETRDELMDKRRELWREENRLQSVVQAAQKELETAEHSLQRMTDRNTWQGIKNVRRIKEEHELDGVYGTLAELFEVNELYRTAVEVTAGQSLFHYVVDSDETATKVLDILQRERGGRVTFMPLNRLRPRTVNLPKSADAVQMLSRITYDRKFEKAFQQVFGKTVICPSLSIAAQFARSHGVSAITPSGDRADKKGALTGGYHDPRQSRLEGARREARCREELQTQREQHDTIKGELTTLDQQITKAVSELQKIEQRRLQLDSSYGPLRQELRNTSMELQRRREALEVKQRAKENIETEERRLGKEQEAYEAELATDFKKSLSQSEEHQLETLGSTVQHLRKQLSELSSNRSDLEARKRALEVELGENLRLRLDQLTTHDVENGNDGDISGGNASSRLKDRHRDLKRVNKILEDLEKKVLGAERMIEKAIQQLAEVEKSKAEKQQQQEELARAMERHQKRMEKSMQKKALLTENLAECNRGLRDLGVVPEDAFKKYDKWESDKVTFLTY